MKRKKILILAMALGVFFSFCVAASADTWQVCTISETGINAQTGVAFVRLTLVSGAAWDGPRWFTATADNAKSVLAVALTAISTGSQVNVWLEGIGEWALIKGLFCKSQ